MARIYHLLLPLFSIFLVRVDLTDLMPLHLTAVRFEVVDGDTVHIYQGKRKYRIRLLYIDAPERGQRAGKVDLGEFSTKCLKELISSPINLRVHGHDQYGRMLAEINEVSLAMIENGCAYIYEYSRFPSRRQRTRFQVAQNKSQKHNRGLWKFKVLNPRNYRQTRYRFQ